MGGKNANLGELMVAGVRVPPGFAVTTQAYLEFMQRGRIGERVAALVSAVDPQDVGSLTDAAADARALIRATPVPGGLAAAIQTAYLDLSRSAGAGALSVAVRSSASVEDLPDASFAGQLESFLCVVGVDAVVDKVRACWSSAFTARALAYCAEQSLSPAQIAVGVGIQEMVDARAAGVMFTLNPMNGDLSKIIIDGSWGLGESVVVGEVTPDSFTVDKVTLDLIGRRIADKPGCRRASPGGDGVDQVDLPAEERLSPRLGDRDVIEIGQARQAHRTALRRGPGHRRGRAAVPRRHRVEGVRLAGGGGDDHRDDRDPHRRSTACGRHRGEGDHPRARRLTPPRILPVVGAQKNSSSGSPRICFP